MFAWQIQTKCFSNVSAFMRLGSTTLPRPNYVNNFNAYQMQLTEGNINVLDVPIWASYLHCWKGMKWDFCEMFGSMLCVAWSCWHVREHDILLVFHIGNFFFKRLTSFDFFFSIDYRILHSSVIVCCVHTVGCNLKTKFKLFKKSHWSGAWLDRKLCYMAENVKIFNPTYR